jgi:hypothetical protein
VYVIDDVGISRIKHFVNVRTEISVPRSVVHNKSQLLSIHVFADASQLALCAAVYVLVLRVTPKNVSIPSLELVAAHTLAKLLSHVNRALSSLDILRMINVVGQFDSLALVDKLRKIVEVRTKSNESNP